MPDRPDPQAEDMWISGETPDFPNLEIAHAGIYSPPIIVRQYPILFHSLIAQELAFMSRKTLQKRNVREFAGLNLMRAAVARLAFFLHRTCSWQLFQDM